MNTNNLEVNAVAEATRESEFVVAQLLSDLELAFVGGGNAGVIIA